MACALRDEVAADDAVIAVISLKLVWKDLREGRLTLRQIQEVGFLLFLFGRAVGTAAEVADHRAVKRIRAAEVIPLVAREHTAQVTNTIITQVSRAIFQRDSVL